MSKNKKTALILSAILVILILLFGIAYSLTRKPTENGTKTINVTIIFEDKSQKKYNIKTDKKYLADALLDEKIIEKDEYENGDGMYTIICGLKADYTKDKSWWCVSENGEMSSVGMNEIPIINSNKYEIKYMKDKE